MQEQNHNDYYESADGKHYATPRRMGSPFQVFTQDEAKTRLQEADRQLTEENIAAALQAAQNGRIGRPRQNDPLTPMQRRGLTM